MELYFHLAYKSPSEVGQLMAQLRLAEDSVVGIYLLTHLPDSRTAIVEDAFLQFDVELTWEKFVKQRRRWYNSNFACAKYLLLGSKGHPHTMFGSTMSSFRKVALSICLVRWIISLVISKFMIGIVGAIAFHSNYALLIQFVSPETANTISLALLSVYLLVYMMFVWVHLKRPGSMDCSFHSGMWSMAYIVSASTMLSVLVWILALTLQIQVCFGNFNLTYFMFEIITSITIFQIFSPPFNSIKEFHLSVSLSVLGIFIAWFRTIYMDRKRVTNILLNLGSFMHLWMSSPMINSFLHAYCLARAMDLSWGNRPGKELQTVNQNGSVKACQKTCQMEHCPAFVELSGSNLCKDHIWFIQNMCLWKYINFAVVCLNIYISLFSLQSTWLITMVPIITNWDSVMVIFMDLANFIKTKLVSGFHKTLYKSHQYKQLPLEDLV